MKIDHITIIISDVEQTRRFYLDFLGMSEVSRPAFGFPGVWFELDGFQIHATKSDQFAGEAGPGNRRANSLSRGQHFAFATDSFDEIVNRISQFSLTIVGGPKQRPDGVDQVYVADPDGYVVEICGQAAG